MIHKGNGCSGRLPLPTSTNISNYMSVERIFYTPPSLPASESMSVGRTRWNTNQCTYIDRVPVSVSEWLLGSFVLMQYLSNSSINHKYWTAMLSTTASLVPLAASRFPNPLAAFQSQMGTLSSVCQAMEVRNRSLQTRVT